ncbi:replication initiator protein [Microviridae sp.]|nr:replication initiator protein [Microviridae sp.]
MRCVHPIRAFRAVGGGVSFARHQSLGIDMSVRCGQCIGCRLNHAREWAVRMTHESQMHPTNCTLTLTYDDEHLPRNGSLNPDDHRDFIKRLRKRTDRRIRYYHCGEYGERTKRPHYHTVLFGYDFPDKRFVENSPSGHPLYRSPTLDRAWGNGRALIGSLSFESAQYVAKYATKAINVSKASSQEAHRQFERRYERVDPDTGEVVQVRPEYVTMSRKPGIGKDWLMKYLSDVYPSDFVVLDGKKHPVPRYYDRVLEEIAPELHDELKRARQENRDRSNDDLTRLAAMETCALARTNLNGNRE